MRGEDVTFRARDISQHESSAKHRRHLQLSRNKLQRKGTLDCSADMSSVELTKESPTSLCMLDDPKTSLSAGATPPSNPPGPSGHLLDEFEGGNRVIDELDIWPMQNDVVDYYEELLNDDLSNSVRFWPQPTELGDDVNDVDQPDGFLLFASALLVNFIFNVSLMSGR